MDVPDLIIPIRMDPSKVTTALTKVGSAGRKAGDDVEAGAKVARRGLGDLTSGADKATHSLLNLTKAQMGMNMLKGVASAMTTSLNEAADYARKMAADFVAIQKTMQSIASITGNQNQDKFVLSEVKKAKPANLMPAEWTDFRTKLMAKASMYVGDQPGAKLNAKESDVLQAQSAEFAKGKGISSGTMANLVGGMLAQEKGKTTAKEMMKKLGKVYATLEASSTDPEQFMAGMTELMAAGFTAEKGAATIAAMPEIAPGQEATYVQRTVMELGQQQREGKIGAKQGLHEGMDPREQLKAVTKYLQNEMAKANTPEEKEKILQRAVGEMTAEAVALRTLTGLARQAPGAMQQWEDIGAKTPDDQVVKSIEEDRQSDARRRRAAEAKLAAGKAEIGGKNAPTDLMRKQAEAELTKEDRFAHAGMANTFNSWLAHPFGGMSTRDQQINVRALRNAKRAAGEEDHTNASDIEGANKGGTEKILENLLRKIEENTRKKDQAPIVAGLGGALAAALAAPPAGGAGKRGA